MLGRVLLKKYRVGRLLDEGGMSKIYLVQTLDQRREAVVKVLKESLLGNAKVREHFRREIHIMSRFSHPHAVAYYDSVPNDSQGPLLIMEYLRGVDLNLLIQRGGRMQAERVGRLLAQLCEVLQAAHQAGIVHRDLKPGNLMVLYPGTPQETLKLMDFGLAKMSSMLYISPEELVDWTLPAASGTPEYISPEQIRGSEIDGRGDLYSVGVILFELLTGRRPFEGSNVQNLLAAHADKAPPSFAQLGLADLIPPALEDVVRWCLEKHPEDRPSSAVELVARYEQGLGKRVRQPSRVVPALYGSALKPPPPAPALAPPAPKGPPPLPDRNVVQHRVEAVMLEVMAMMKLKGFILDLGGEVVESVPGMIKVRLAAPEAPKPKTGLFGWGKPSSPVQAPSATEIEVHMERRDPGQANKLTITLVMRAGDGSATPEWRSRCDRISRDLQAYLMGR
jgi:serine/threonine-protein kinase